MSWIRRVRSRAACSVCTGPSGLTLRPSFSRALQRQPGATDAIRAGEWIPRTDQSLPNRGGSVHDDVVHEPAEAGSVVGDAAGNVHILHRDGRGVLRYRFSADGWQERALAESTRKPMGLDVDAEGRVHALYATNDPARLIYATLAESGWARRVVAKSSIGGCDLAIGPNGHAHVCYADTRGRMMYYATTAPDEDGDKR
jgi:hypothetical protein